MANVRTQLAPEPGDDLATECTCADCGETFWRWRADYQLRCVRCAQVRAVDGAESMRLKRGPMYEKAALKQLAYWTAEVERLGLKPGG